MADTNERYELAKLIDDIIDCAVHAGACDARKGFGAFTESDSMSMTAMRRSISQKRAQIIGHFDESNATPPADAALAESAAVDCLRACAKAMRIFDRPDTAAEVDRATDAISAALRARAVPDGFVLVRKEWMPIISEVDRRAEKMDGRNCDFTVTICADEYRAADDADRGVTVEDVVMLAASKEAKWANAT